MYNKEALHSILMNEDFKTVNDRGKVLPPSHEVYQRISIAMLEKGSVISAKHVYTIVNSNRGGIYDIICQSFSVNVEFDISADSSFNASGNNRTLKKTLTNDFKLIISAGSWKKISPRAKICTKRKYYVLKAQKWTSVFAEKIWQQTKISCAFAFKRAKVYANDNAKCYANFEANCKECGGHLIGILYKRPATKTDVVFECRLTGARQDVTHENKRYLKGYLRDQVAQKMVDERKHAAGYRIEEANRLMDPGDSVPPILFSNEVLRKAKQQELEKRLQISGVDPVENLYTAKYTTVQNTIHVISKEPFICMYWLQEQQAMYAAAQKFDPNSFFVIDATGTVGKKLRLPDGSQSQHLFLYQCLCVSKLGNFPAFQCVSAIQDAATITYFLFQIVKSNPIPRIVVSNFGLAILIAIARAFCGIDLRHYMQCCHLVVVLKHLDMLPKCFIRLDVSHFIAMIARWPSLRGKLPRVRQFYLRSIGRVYQLHSFAEVEELLKAVLVVALSENIGVSENNETLPSEDYLQKASRHIRGIVNQVDANEEEADELPSPEEEEESTGWKHWADSLYNAAKQIASTCENSGLPNPYHNPEVATKLKNLMNYLPLWTGIIRLYFECDQTIASSSYVEAEFSKLKNYFKGQLPMRIDKFVLHHIEYLRGSLKLTSGECHTNEFTVQTVGSDNGNLSALVNDQTFDALISTIDSCESDANNVSFENSNSCVECDESTCAIETTKENEMSHDGNETTHENEFRHSFETSIEIPSNRTKNLTTETEYTVDKNPEQEISEESTKNLTEDLKNENHDDDMIESLNICENWKGKITSEKKSIRTTQNVERSKPNYLDPCPEWDASRYNKAVTIPLILNGNLSGPVNVNSKLRIVVKDTCAFDSLLQITANAIVTNPVYGSIMQKSDNSLVRLAQDLITIGKLKVEHYARRATILRHIPLLTWQIKTRHVETFCAKCNVAHLAEYLFADAPSYTVVQHCANCHTAINIRPSQFLGVNVNILLREGCHRMQQAIDDVRLPNAAACKKCGSSIEIKTTYGPHVIIETSVFTHNSYLKTMRIENAQCVLSSISKDIELDREHYALAGVVHFDVILEHYVAYAWTGLCWHAYNDLRKKREVVEESTSVCLHLILYVRAT